MTYAVAGITGKVGAAVARNLLAQGRQVRAVVRDLRKAQPWTVPTYASRGCRLDA